MFLELTFSRQGRRDIVEVLRDGARRVRDDQPEGTTAVPSYSGHVPLHAISSNHEQVRHG